MHSAAGLIDVSTLGKLIVRGPDAGEFLDRLYPNRFSNLKPGRIRYGVISARRRAGSWTTARSAGSTTTRSTSPPPRAAPAPSSEWFSWWLADWGIDVHLTDVTQALVGGQPRRARARARSWARSPTSTARPRRSPTSTASRRRSPGVPCLILRIGFVGEVGYEIHCPARARRARSGTR